MATFASMSSVLSSVVFGGKLFMIVISICKNKNTVNKALNVYGGKLLTRQDVCKIVSVGIYFYVGKVLSTQCKYLSNNFNHISILEK